MARNKLVVPVVPIPPPIKNGGLLLSLRVGSSKVTLFQDGRVHMPLSLEHPHSSSLR